MAHQFSALHRDGFVAVSHKTRERLREVNMLALGLITEMSAHIDGFPVTLNAIIKRAKKPGATALREAYQDLIDERLVVYVQYTLQLPGKRPYPSGTTVIAHEAITDEEFTSEVVDKFTPGKFVLDRQADDEVRKVKVLAATVRHWGGEKKITEDGALAAPAPKKKPGPKSGSGSSKRPSKVTAPKSGVELDASSSTSTRDDAAAEQVGVELGVSSSTPTCENKAFAQGNVELDNVDSTTPSSLTRTGDKNTNHTTEAAASESATSGNDGWLESSAQQKNDHEPTSTGAALLTTLERRHEAHLHARRDQCLRTIDAAIEVLSYSEVLSVLGDDLDRASKPSGALVSRIRALPKRVETRKAQQAERAAWQRRATQNADRRQKTPRPNPTVQAPKQETSPVSWLTDEQYNELPVKDQAHLRAWSSTPEEQLNDHAAHRLAAIRSRFTNAA